jgi:hypothetical protein
VHEHVGALEQLREPFAARQRAHIESRGALATQHFGDHAWLVPIRRVDAQHIRTETREQAGARRPREYACQVQHAHAGEEPVRAQRQRPRHTGLL